MDAEERILYSWHKIKMCTDVLEDVMQLGLGSSLVIMIGEKGPAFFSDTQMQAMSKDDHERGEVSHVQFRYWNDE